MENTPQSDVSQAKTSAKSRLQSVGRLRGVPGEMLCRATDVIEELGITRETWRLWRAAGLKVCMPSPNAEFVLTSHLIEFIASEKEIPKRRSHKKKERTK